jgi:hypothetical protein
MYQYAVHRVGTKPRVNRMVAPLLVYAKANTAPEISR